MIPASSASGVSASVVTEADIVEAIAEALFYKIAVKIPQATPSRSLLNYTSEETLKQLFSELALNFNRKISIYTLEKPKYIDKNLLIKIAAKANLLHTIVFQTSHTGFSYTGALYKIFKDYQHPYLFSHIKTQGKLTRHYFAQKITNKKRFNQDMIEQFYKFFLTIEDPDISTKSKVHILNKFDIYCTQYGLPNYRQLRQKPLYTLLNEIRRVLSVQKGEFIAMSQMLKEILKEEKTFYNQILNNDHTSRRGLTAQRVQKLWNYCKENIRDNNDKAYIERLIIIIGYYLNDVILTDQDSLKKFEREIIAKLKDKLNVLNIWNEEFPSMAELIDYFGINFFDIVSEVSKRRFKRVFKADEIAKILDKILQDLAPIDSKGYKELSDMLKSYKSVDRIRDIKNEYGDYEGWLRQKYIHIHGDTSSQYPKIWKKVEFQNMIRSVLFPRQGGFITTEGKEKIYHVFNGFTGEVFSWKKLTLIPSLDVVTGEVILVAMDENKQEVGVIHHIDFDKNNNRIDNYLWILRKNHITKLNDANKREYIGKGMMASLAFEYGYAPRFWSYEAL